MDVNYTQVYKAIKYLLQTLISDDDKMYLLSRFTSPMKDFHDFYISGKIVPSSDMPIHTYPFKKKQLGRMGVVVYGPVISENYFTLNSLKLYTHIFTNTPIVFVTPPSYKLTPISDANIPQVSIVEMAVRADDPQINRIRNMTQYCIAGLEALKRQSIDYAVVIRSDFRITYDNSFCYLQHLINRFPPAQSVHDQNARIVACSKNTLRYMPYNISNDFLFGNIEDILSYWDNPITRPILHDTKMVLENAEDYVLRPKLILGILYAKYRLAQQFRFNLSTYYELLANRYIIVDDFQLGLIQHNNSVDGFGEFEEDYHETLHTLGFNDWLLIYDNIVDCKKMDKLYDGLISELKTSLILDNLPFEYDQYQENC